MQQLLYGNVLHFAIQERDLYVIQNIKTYKKPFQNLERFFFVQILKKQID